MSRTVWVGAVAYDPKVVTIWEGMRSYFHEEARLSVEVVLFQNYEAQVSSLLEPLGKRVPYIDIAWNTNLAYLQADVWSGQRCRPIAMRDTDIGWMTKIVAATGGSVTTLADVRGRTLALGSRDSGHAAILPVHFLEKEGLQEGKDYRALRFNSDSNRSPTMPSAATLAPASTASASERPGKTMRAPMTNAAVPNTSPPIAPSSVFFGLIDGASGRRPSARPV